MLQGEMAAVGSFVSTRPTQADLASDGFLKFVQR